MTGRAGLALAVALLCAGCGSAPTIGPAQVVGTPAPPQDPGYVTKEHYAREWPFTIPAGTVRCYPNGVNGPPYITFDNGNGVEYALNGAAGAFGFQALDGTILKDYPNTSAVQPFIELGLTLC